MVLWVGCGYCTEETAWWYVDIILKEQSAQWCVCSVDIILKEQSAWWCGCSVNILKEQHGGVDVVWISY